MNINKTCSLCELEKATFIWVQDDKSILFVCINCVSKLNVTEVPQETKVIVKKGVVR